MSKAIQAAIYVSRRVTHFIRMAPLYNSHFALVIALYRFHGDYLLVHGYVQHEGDDFGGNIPHSGNSFRLSLAVYRIAGFFRSDKNSFFSFSEARGRIFLHTKKIR